MNKSVQLVVALGLAIPSVAARSQDEAGIADTAAVSSTVGVAAASAATDSEGGEKRAGGSRMVEEVIVTAQKREERLMDVPISIQSFSPEALDARGVSSTTDLMKITPALDYGTQAGDFTSVYMRGIGSEAWLTSDPSVASYVDGVYYPFSPSVAQDLLGVERVEVLKGPQGTLFGRNANGGAINVITKEPNFNDDSVTVSLYHGTFETTKAQMFANIPLAESFSANVAANYEYTSDIWRSDSTIGGAPVTPIKTASGRVKLRWVPTERSDLRLTIQGAKRDGHSTLAAPISPTALGVVTDNLYLGGADKVVGNAKDRIVNPDLPIYGHLQSFVTALTGIYNFDFLDVKLLGSNQVHSNPYNYDYDGTAFPGASFIVHKHYAKIQQAELQLLSNEGTWGSDWLTLTGGAFYFHNEQGFDPVEVTVGGLNPAQLAAAGLPLDGLIPTELDGLILNLANGTFPTYALSNVGMVNAESIAYYLQASVKLTDTLQLTAGGRYQAERKGVVESNTSVRVGPGIIEPQVFTWNYARDNHRIGQNIPLHDTTKGFKPKVAVDWKPGGGDTLLYASYQEAVKAHSYNAFAFYLRPAYVPEEEMKAKEVGMKTTLFDNTTRFTLAAWRYDLTNLQTQAISLLNGGALSISTAGNARSQGVEFDVFAELFPSVFSGLVLTVNGAYIDGKYTEYVNGQGHVDGTGIFLPGGLDLTGNRIPRTPKYTGSAALSQTFQIPGGPLEMTVSTYYNDGFNYEATENPMYEQPSYQTWNAHISYLWEAQNLRFTLLGKNLTDEFYTAGSLLLDWTQMASLGSPRTIGLKLDWTF